MHYYISAFKNYSNFYGRATRAEFWVYQLINLVLIFITISADHALGTCFKYDLGDGVKLLPYGYVFAAYALATLLPALALQVRRLHDTGKSGWFIFLALIPIAGGCILMVLFCLDSDAGDNKYGPNPKQQQAI